MERGGSASIAVEKGEGLSVLKHAQWIVLNPDDLVCNRREAGRSAADRGECHRVFVFSLLEVLQALRSEGPLALRPSPVWGRRV